jgi:hypothetical protein
MSIRIRSFEIERKGISSFAAILLIFFLAMAGLVVYVAWYQTTVVRGELVEARASPDCTQVYFRVKNMSSDKIYTRWYVNASIAPSSPNFRIDPQVHQIESLGPGAQSIQYSFDISAKGVPKGTYQVMLRLYNGTTTIYEQGEIHCTVT